MPNPVHPESTPHPTGAELSPDNVALATEIIRGIRRQRPHDPQALAMTVNQLIRMQLVELQSRLRFVVPDYFSAKAAATVDPEPEDDETSAASALRLKKK